MPEVKHNIQLHAKFRSLLPLIFVARCCWLLREDVLDAGEDDALDGLWERAIGDALTRDEDSAQAAA